MLRRQSSANCSFLSYIASAVAVSPTTPSITVETSKTETKGRRIITQTQRIFGGVNLAPADNAVHTLTSAPQAETLAPAVARAITATPLLSPVSFEKDGKRYQAVALPGNNTRDVGAVRLEPTDLVVPVQRGTQIALTRKFNSFFQPSDVFGGTWTLDLPRLEQQRRPTQRTEDKVKYQITYQLTSPLNTWSDNSVGLARDNDKRIGYPTKSLFRDKRRWHFNEQGYLVAWAETPLLVVYRRDQAQRLRRIEGWYGKSLRADIKFKYDTSGRLLSAHGSNDEVVNYKYDDSGMLKVVASPQDNLEYAYKNGLITALTQSGKTRKFYYNARGQLQKERLPDGTTVAYTTNSGSQGTKVTTTRAGKIVESVQYNAAFQPTQRTFDDGSQIVWRQNGTGAVETTLTSSEGEQYVVTTDGNKQTTWQFPEGGTYKAEYTEGHLTTLKQGERPILRQDWLRDGRLISVISETTALHPEYRDDGVLTNVLVSPPGKGPFNRWVKFQYDEQGRTGTIKDYSGSEISMAYDKNGELSTLASNRGSAKIKRDDQGRVAAVQTSWGYGQTNIYDHGEIKAINFSQGNETASIKFDQDRPTIIRQFDGAEWVFSYHNQRVKEINTPNDVVLIYEYDADNRLVAVHFDEADSIKYSYDDRGHLVKVMRVSK
ncbi:YD repeat-containing protein [Candidatus Thiomargarita nelsonii]|uniref:YD repeat-containing protein n=1 Tax=Candidatus Thiomargarita nelsonii TaxID=1003181 RepID=A0A0A6NZL8_9GAMM|nr:YD repeat-containing protein [Candidatus Thiomargarita nelsonii]